jgi:predicted MFS family arabinose efflux permease
VARGPVRTDLVVGLRWLRGNVLVRTLVGLAALANFTTFMTLSTMVLFAQQVLHLDKAAYGLLVSGMAVGGIVGSLLSGRVVSGLGLRTTVRVVPLLAPLVFLAVGLLGRNALVVGALLAVSSFALSLWNVVSFTLRQICVPSELLGRVGGAAKTIAFGVGPLGSLVGGLVAHQWGLAAPWILAGAVRLVFALLAVSTLRSGADQALAAVEAPAAAVADGGPLPRPAPVRGRHRAPNGGQRARGGRHRAPRRRPAGAQRKGVLGMASATVRSPSLNTSP